MSTIKKKDEARSLFLLYLFATFCRPALTVLLSLIGAHLIAESLVLPISKTGQVINKLLCFV